MKLNLKPKKTPVIDHSDSGSLLNPLKNLQFLARKPITEPLKPRLASLNYRGFHLNDWEECVGCASCQKICDNAAITMVEIPSLPNDPVKGIRNHRPAIDYGRCCWCALCVDICPSSSLSLSREYVHTCDQEHIDSYFILPDPNGMHKEHFGKGWQKTEHSDLLSLTRSAMAELEPETRIDNFDEIVDGFTPEQAVLEASRCVQCGMCHDSCPTNMHAPEYIRAIWNNDAEEAVRQIYRTNPFAHVCGRVCTRRCEDACSIGIRGEPIAIRWLKRYAMDSVSHERIKEIVNEGSTSKSSGKKIAIIGAGPAGLTAAFDLVRSGHKVEVFEALPHAGGMTRYGIPEYRLPFDTLQQDIDIITSLGVTIHYDCKIGKNKRMSTLHKNFDAVILAIGLSQGRQTRIKNSDHRHVYRAVDLLQKISSGEEFELPHSVAVIGGGNVAMDIARSLARLQKQQYGKVQITLTALEEQQHFMADPDEIKESLEEGIIIKDSCGPQGCEIDTDGKLIGLKTWKVTSIFDEQHRFVPQYDEEQEVVHNCEAVIEAIGQFADTSLLGKELTEQLEWNRGRLQVDADGRTSEDWLWSAGDCVNGPDVVHAVADGHRVAASIEQQLMSTTKKNSSGK
ncbi:MAG: FAD-dependent oxidoreductase [Gammaproteobacteria bacterium]|jgi:glutamate synthase (NADPH/NADH) small chain|nr:FAD-dependent oxidoreductase [Gammaproteobacteria bacterium]MBT3722060.1 FAD-dependent oxidoreductase [Gammaproteobacteria bacterium]MBT4195953.1 FAD-dependent oxidoreductase [Gammaproteobacteria bacterium]MBT4451575.1 FAD-dependent oxidoreductase [Gammaproteobacteria bacterium]MBT4860183.1 FAD-dependent oxidoreductase [Gammaproteobacteria bacterium]